MSPDGVVFRGVAAFMARSLTAFDSPESLAVVIVVQPGLRVGVVMLLTLAPVDAPAGEEPHQLQEAQAEKSSKDLEVFFPHQFCSDWLSWIFLHFVQILPP